MEMYQEMMMITNSNGGALNEDGSSGEGGSGGGGGGTHLKKGPWTATEDAILTEYVKRHGEGNWNAVQRNSGLSRCGKSCRLRWANHLRPNLKKGSFSPEEERLIVQLHAKFGNKWARMAAQLPGRTDNEIKNYWNTRIKRRHRQGLPLYPPDVKPEHPQAQQQSQRNQQQQQQQQSPQQSQPTSTPFSSAPTTPLSSTPTTPTSSFSFPTQLLSPTPTTPPPSLSPTPPPLSPIPSPNSTFPTLPLFDPFSLPRTPPLLSNSIRFKRHHLDTITNNNTTTNTPTNTSFSLPFSSSCFTQANASCPLSRLPSFQLSPMPMVPDQSVYSVKPELPSSQFASQTGHSDITFDTKMNGNNGLLEDLLEEAHALANGESFKRPSCMSFQEENRVFNGFGSQWGGSSSSMNLSSAFEPKGEATEQINTMHEDLSKFFNGASSTMQGHEWYSDSGELSNGQSSVVTDDNLGLDMQHIVSLFPAGTSTDPGKTSNSCSWDNLPGIC